MNVMNVMNGMQWNGMEWNGMECMYMLCTCIMRASSKYEWLEKTGDRRNTPDIGMRDAACIHKISLKTHGCLRGTRS